MLSSVPCPVYLLIVFIPHLSFARSNSLGQRVGALFEHERDRAGAPDKPHWDGSWVLIGPSTLPVVKVTDHQILAIAEKLGFDDFDEWEEAWDGRGRGSASKKDWQRGLLRKLQAGIYLSLANTDKSEAIASVGCGGKNECFRVVPLLLREDAIFASLTRPKNFDLSLAALRCILGTMALVDIAATNPAKNGFGKVRTSKTGKKEQVYEVYRNQTWPTAIKDLERAVAENGLLKQDENVSTAALAYYLSALSLACIALPIKNEAAQGAKALFNVVKGAYEVVSPTRPSFIELPNKNNRLRHKSRPNFHLFELMQSTKTQIRVL